ncbi:MAG: PorT family protein, partial [Flavobacteriaceae bacterium]|nr:PorT family protein [Flavobacteriaceae bacterium]
MIFFTSNSFAQNNNDLEFGFFAGVSLASVSEEENVSDLESKIALNAGFFSEYFFYEKWSLKAKIYYDQRGFDNAPILIIDGINNRTERGSFIFHNLTIPVLVNFNFGNNERFYLNIGPYASYIFSAEKSEGETESTDDFNSVDFGLEGGIGFKFSFSNKNEKSFFLEYAGQKGFSDLDNNEFGTIKNIQHSLNFGFKF